MIRKPSIHSSWTKHHHKAFFKIITCRNQQIFYSYTLLSRWLVFPNICIILYEFHIKCLKPLVLHIAYESIAYFLKQTFENPYYVYMNSIKIRIQKERRHYYYYNMDNGKLDKTNVPFIDMIKNLHNWHKIRRIISLGFCTSQLFSLMTFVSWMLAHIVRE